MFRYNPRRSIGKTYGEWKAIIRSYSSNPFTYSDAIEMETIAYFDTYSEALSFIKNEASLTIISGEADHEKVFTIKDSTERKIFAKYGDGVEYAVLVDMAVVKTIKI